jgi:hypothetical protein
MKIAISLQENYSIPKACCICGGGNPTINHKIQSNEIRGMSTKTRFTMIFMKCQVCMDELKALNRSAAGMSTPGTLIGGVIGLLIGLGIGFAMFQASGGDTSRGIVNDLIGPLCACGGFPALLGAIGGAMIGQKLWRHKLDPATRKKFDSLSNPVKLELSAEQGWLGNIKSGVMRLEFTNDAYGILFSQLNNGLLESIYCSKCGKEVIELDPILGMRSWCGNVCLECKKLYCTDCLPTSFKIMPCPDCGKPTEHADEMNLVKAGIISIHKTL